MNWLEKLLFRLQTEPAVLVTVQATRGSVPRDTGTWMAIFQSGFLATIGGGRLEQDAMGLAHSMLVAGATQAQNQTFSLGPSLGQCCGGEVQLQFEPVSGADVSDLALRLKPSLTPVALFGGGHVGHALVRVLGNLPMQVNWFDSRDEVFPADLPAQVSAEHCDPLESAVADLKPGTRVLIMSFSHAEDFAVVAACLKRQRGYADLPYIGLIGSKTKWAAFRNRLGDRGFTAQELDHVTCPIGVTGIDDKRPEAIAVAAAAQLLQVGAWLET